MTVRVGLDRLLDEYSDLIAGQRLALLINHTSVTSEGEPAPLALRERGHDVRLLLGPEHGVWGTHQDMEAVPGGRESVFDLPVLSLYGLQAASLKPASSALRDIDAIVYDIQDVGARYYTFLVSLKYVMAAAARFGKQVIVCDRPNPIGGREIEGNRVRSGFESFVGCSAIANRHGMTAGELARWFASEFDASPGAPSQGAASQALLGVVPMEGWRRDMHYGETGLVWVSPSPNMPTPETALVYPGMCLLEGTNLSEGRGTTRPFERFGAPYVSALPFSRALNAAGVPGARFRPTVFRPMFQKFAGELCEGAEIDVVDRFLFRPVLAGLAVLAVARRLYPEAFRWRSETYEFVTDRLAIDLLGGSESWRRGIEAGDAAETILARDSEELAAFEDARARFLGYPDEEGA